MSSWALAFLFTLVVETPVYVLALRTTFGRLKALAISLTLNIATHPIAWSTIMASPNPYVFVAVEGAVMLAEGLALFALGQSRFARQGMGLGRSFVIAIAANGFSAGLGLLL